MDITITLNDEVINNWWVLLSALCLIVPWVYGLWRLSDEIAHKLVEKVEKSVSEIRK